MWCFSTQFFLSFLSYPTSNLICLFTSPNHSTVHSLTCYTVILREIAPRHVTPQLDICLTHSKDFFLFFVVVFCLSLSMKRSVSSSLTLTILFLTHFHSFQNLPFAKHCPERNSSLLSCKWFPINIHSITIFTTYKSVVKKKLTILRITIELYNSKFLQYPTLIFDVPCLPNTIQYLHKIHYSLFALPSLIGVPLHSSHPVPSPYRILPAGPGETRGPEFPHQHHQGDPE